jgi:hypothetical protein
MLLLWERFHAFLMIKLYDWILFAANASLMDESAGRLAHVSVNNKADEIG